MDAYCYATGQIQFGTVTPRGCIRIATGDDKPLRDLIEGTARLAYDNRTLLVPGVPEAPNETAKIRALHRYVRWITKSLPRGVVTIYSPARASR